MTQAPPPAPPPLTLLAVGALVLLAIAGAAIGALSGGARGDATPSGVPTPTGSAAASVVPGGSVWAAATPTLAPTPSPTPSPTPTATPTPSPAATPALEVGAEVQVCRGQRNGQCVDEQRRVEGDFVALVRFDASAPGDRMGMRLEGPGGAVVNGPTFTVQGGPGAAWWEFNNPLARGDWRAVATRNGADLASTEFSVR